MPRGLPTLAFLLLAFFVGSSFGSMSALGTADAQPRKKRKRAKKAAPAKTPAKAPNETPKETKPTDDKNETSDETGPAKDSDASSPAKVRQDGVKTKKGKRAKEKLFDFTALQLDGSTRMPQLLYFLERASEELQRASLKRRSFVPEMVRSLDEDAL